MITVHSLLKAKPKTEVITVRPDQNLLEATRLLAQHHIGALVVTQGEYVHGIISERDIVRQAAVNCPLDQMQVSEIMTRDLIYAFPQDNMNYIKAVMTGRFIRHLPVLEGNRMIGIISIGDVIKAQINDAIFEINSLQDYITGRYPA